MNRSLLYRYVLSLSRVQKQAVMLAFDIFALTLALWSGYALRLAEWWPSSYIEDGLPLFIITPIVGIIIFIKLGLYRAVVRFFSGQAIMTVVKGVFALTLCLYSFAVLLEINNFPRSIPINFALAALLYVGGSRMAIRHYYQWLLSMSSDNKPVIIYGAGSAGLQLATALEKGKEYSTIAFLDDNKSLWGRIIQGVQIYSPTETETLVSKHNPQEILVALPTAEPEERKRILNFLSEFETQVKVMPSMPQIVHGDKLPELRDVQVDDLLGRAPVPPLPGLMEDSLKEKSVLVTGAGGSIGSEIARQALTGGAKTLVLYELSEFALYSIDQELKTIPSQCRVIPILGSVLNQYKLEAVISKYAIHTFYHAAAYKHVPLVEHNISEGVVNNTIGTYKAATAAYNKKIERFVLISTDKAVRPTNIMGATKRAAELVIQDLAKKSEDTIFSMVRFGNVLGSSGSVVPLFTKQIESGGPITVTHKDINRYFMTIPEASTLVIQAGSMAKGGEVFVLDMGEVVKISDLAHKMITLMGRTIKDNDNPKGDIAIEYTGLRPGEKLYEELLIGDNVGGTNHSKILQANEKHLDSALLEDLINKMESAIENADSEMLKELIAQTVDEYTPSEHNVDWLAPATTNTQKVIPIRVDLA